MKHLGQTDLAGWSGPIGSATRRRHQHRNRAPTQKNGQAAAATQPVSQFTPPDVWASHGSRRASQFL